MDSSLRDGAEKISLLGALDITMAHLHQASQQWPFADALLRMSTFPDPDREHQLNETMIGSLEKLRGRTWMQFDLQQLLILAGRVSTPLMQSVSEMAGSMPSIPAPVSLPRNFSASPIGGMPPMTFSAEDEPDTVLNWLECGEEDIQYLWPRTDVDLGE
jgi:hypothetical protein